jgi:hypothetical protein
MGFRLSTGVCSISYDPSRAVGGQLEGSWKAVGRQLEEAKIIPR